MIWPKLAVLCFASFSVKAADIESVFGELKRRSLGSSPEIRSAHETYRQRAAAHYTSFTQWLPQIKLEVSQTRSKDYSLLTSGGLGEFLGAGVPFVPEDVDLTRWTLVGTWALYSRGVYIGADIAAREKDLAISNLDARRTEHDWKIRAALGRYLLAAYRETAGLSAVETGRTSLREARTRFELGQRSRLDVLRAQANLAALEAKLASHQQATRAERAALLELTGLVDEDLRAIGLESIVKGSDRQVEAAVDSFTRVGPLLDKVRPYLGADPKSRTARVVSHGLGYRLIEDERDLAMSRAGALTTSEWPQLLAQATYGKQATEASQAFSSGQNSYSMGVVLSVPLFSGGSLFSRWRERVAAESGAKIQTGTAARSLFNTVENQRLQIEALSKTLESGRVLVEQNEEIVRLSDKSYELGRTTTLELLTAQNDLLSSRVELVDAKIKLAVLLRQFAWNVGVDSP